MSEKEHVEDIRREREIWGEIRSGPQIQRKIKITRKTEQVASMSNKPKTETIGYFRNRNMRRN